MIEDFKSISLFARLEHQDSVDTNFSKIYVVGPAESYEEAVVLHHDIEEAFLEQLNRNRMQR